MKFTPKYRTGMSDRFGGLTLKVPMHTSVSSGWFIQVPSRYVGDTRRLELGRYRFFKSVSVFGFLVGFSKGGVGFGIGFSARTYHCLLVTPSLTPYAFPFPPNGVWALEFALQIAAIRDRDIVTIDNL